MKVVFYVNKRRSPIAFPDWLLLNSVTIRKLCRMPGFDTFGLSFSKEQLKNLRRTLRQMRSIHGHLCLFDLDDGAGMEFGEKIQLYL